MRTRVALALLLVPSLALAETKAKAPPSVSKVRAYFYFHGTGKLGDKDITSSDVVLHNSIIGEGDAGEPTNAMMVFVDVALPSGSNAPGKLVIEAKEGKTKVAAATFALDSWFAENSKSIALPLFVPNVGCEEVAITATLTPKGGKAAKKTATVGYNCAE